MTRIWWIRHAPTHERSFCGWRDAPGDLSDRAALARLAAALPEGALVGSSDLSRARDTAAAIAGGRPRLAPDPALREFDFGAWDGKTFAEVAASDPDLSHDYWVAPGAAAPPGGESWDAAAARVNAAVDRLIAAYPGQEIALVAHLGVILTQYARAAAITPAAALAQPVDNLSLTRIAVAPDGWRLECVNRLH